VSVQSLIQRFGVNATLWESTETIDTTGSVVQGWASNATSVLIYIQPTSPAESMAYGALRQNISATGYVITGTTPFPVLENRIGYDSRLYEITGIRTPDYRAATDELSYYIFSLNAIDGVA
jgi:hypothetical protein